MTQRSRQVKHARRLKALQWAIALAIGASACSPALAMRVGHSRVVSAPGTPLQALVGLQELTPDEVSSLRVSVADEAAWQRAGLKPPAPLASLVVRVEDGMDPTRKNLRVRSTQAPAGGAVDLLLDISSSSGQRQVQVSILVPLRGAGADVTPAAVGAPGRAGGVAGLSLIHISKKWLAEQYGVKVRGYMSQLGPIPIPFVSWDEVPNNPFYAPNADIVAELEAYMDQLRRDGDSVGARIEVVAENLPAGWGEPIYDRLDADIAHVMMGLNAVKGVSIGAGFDCIAQRGSEHGDEITPDGFVTNHAGGVLGGISTGQPVTVSLAIKPTSSIRVERRSVNRANEPVMVQTRCV